MNELPKLYIAGMGVVTAVGGTTAMAAAMVNANISGYAQSRFKNRHQQNITMATVPEALFGELELDIEECAGYDERYDRIIKMGILAIEEACDQQAIDSPIPFILAMPDALTEGDTLSPAVLINNFAKNCPPWLHPSLSRSLYSGRAAGLEAIDFAFNYLLNAPQDFVLIGGSDAFCSYPSLAPFDEDDRLLAIGSQDAFAPGEGAGFLLLTRHPELAMQRNGEMIALHKPGIAEEPGHLHSAEPYRGDGLDQAFKSALVNHQHHNIHSIYSSMNGENHWTKELGVAQIRNKKSFKDNLKIRHPADCYGDLGAATAPVLIALAAEHLFKNTQAHAHLVCSSSDTAKRGAIVVEKMPAVDAARIGEKS